MSDLDKTTAADLDFLGQFEVDTERTVLAQEDESTSGRGTSPEEKAFRETKGSDMALKWVKPGTDPSDGFYELVGEVCALEGIILDSRAGYVQWRDDNSANADASKLVCRTIGVRYPTGKEFHSPRPLENPVMWSTNAFKQPTTPNPELSRYSLYGSGPNRPVMRCSDCVKAGLNGIDARGESGKCELNYHIQMAIFKIGFSRRDVAKKTKYIEWLDVKDVKDETGNTVFTGPFVLDIYIPKSLVWYPVSGTTGTKGKTTDLKTFAAPGELPTTPGQAHADSQTIKKFISSIKKLHVADSSRPAPNLRTIYPTVVQMYQADFKVKPTSGNMEKVPVFNTIPVDNGTLNAMLKAAYAAYNDELEAYKAANGIVDSTPPSLADQAAQSIQTESNGNANGKANGSANGAATHDTNTTVSVQASEALVYNPFNGGAKPIS